MQIRWGGVLVIEQLTHCTEPPPDASTSVFLCKITIMCGCYRKGSVLVVEAAHMCTAAPFSTVSAALLPCSHYRDVQVL
jgi:hypothetical protein